MKNSVSIAAAVLLAACGLVIAAGDDPAKQAPAKEGESMATLKVGGKAPAFSPDKWLKGKEVKSFEKGKVYVVEFWATWCPPCRKSIPHLTELAHKYKDVTFIGITASERPEKDGKDNRLEKAEKFVKEQGEKMDYVVAYEGDNQMNDAWMEAAGQNGIPCAFIVDGDGKIAFIGHPMEEKFEQTIEKLAKHGKKSEKPADKPSEKK